MKRLLLLFAISLPLPLLAQAPAQYPYRFSGKWSISSYVPTTLTAICGAPSGTVCGNDVSLDAMVFANASATAVTVTVTDNSTNCNGGPCKIFPAVSIAANTTYTVPTYGIIVSKGVSWSASAVNSVSGFMKGSY